eukprot:gene19404-29893_t
MNPVSNGQTLFVCVPQETTEVEVAAVRATAFLKFLWKNGACEVVRRAENKARLLEIIRRVVGEEIIASVTSCGSVYMAVETRITNGQVTSLSTVSTALNQEVSKDAELSAALGADAADGGVETDATVMDDTECLAANAVRAVELNGRCTPVRCSRGYVLEAISSAGAEICALSTEITDPEDDGLPTAVWIAILVICSVVAVCVCIAIGVAVYRSRAPPQKPYELSPTNTNTAHRGVESKFGGTDLDTDKYSLGNSRSLDAPDRDPYTQDDLHFCDVL